MLAAGGHGEVGAPAANGYSVSGEVRSADGLQRAGFQHVYDGGGCGFDPVLLGIRRDGSLVYPTRSDQAGVCASKPATKPTAPSKAPPASYSTLGFRVPDPAPKDAIGLAERGAALNPFSASPELARATIASLVVLGALQASSAVKAALADRIG